MATQCSWVEDRDIYPFRFIALASRGYKNWLQFEQHYSHSVFNFYFYGKKIRRQMSWHVLKLDLNSAQWMPKLVSIDAQSYPAFTSQSLRATIGASLESQESYLTTGMLPYKHSSFFPPTHGSIMLPPRQPRVFARLARWQLTMFTYTASEAQ